MDPLPSMSLSDESRQPSRRSGSQPWRGDVRPRPILLSPEEELRLIDALRRGSGGADIDREDIDALLDWAYRAALDAEILALVLSRDLVVDVDRQGRFDFRRPDRDGVQRSS